MRAGADNIRRRALCCRPRLSSFSAPALGGRWQRGPGAGKEGERMAKEWARRFYSSSAWLKCRDSFISGRRAVDGGLCQDCHERLGEIAHHWPVPLTAQNISRPEVSLNHQNLRWVCKACHDLYPGHGVAKPLTALVTFDANGDVVPPSDGATRRGF